jgi:hypothetical protein
VFREHAFQCSNYLIKTPSDLSHIGIIPPINEVTSEFKDRLKKSLSVGPWGHRIFHGNPESDDPMTSEVRLYIFVLFDET